MTSQDLTAIERVHFREGASTDQIPADFLMLLGAVDAVSFDMFDTLIQRDALFCPKDLFYRVQAVIETRYAMHLNDFASVRVRAESIARVRARGRQSEETTLEEIYVEIANILSLPGDLAGDMRQIELECERAALVNLPSGKRLYDAAIRAGKTVVVISDTYLHRSFLEEVLVKAGFNGAHRVYASSEFGKTKHHGALFNIVLKDLDCSPGRLLHVGDNPLSDATAALGQGIRSFICTNPKQRLKWRYGLSDRPSGSQAVSALLCDISRTAEEQLRSTTGGAVIARSAVEHLSWVYEGFAAWLVDQITSRRDTRVYFASRDGLIMKKFFDVTLKALGVSMESRYLYVSRAALYPTLVLTDPDMARRLFCHSWDHLTMTQALKRMSLLPQEVAGQLAKYGLADPLLSLNRVTTLKLSRFLDAIWPLLCAKSESNCALVVDYLRQEGFLTDEPTAFVDIGWHASLQHCLVKLLQYRDFKTPLHGYYLGTFARPDASPDVSARGFLIENDAPASISALIRTGPSLLELFHAAGHGSVLGYERRDGRVVPILEENELEQEQFRTVIEPLQQHAFEFVAARLARGEKLEVSTFPTELVARLGLRILHKPTDEEAEVFGRLRIATDFGGSMKSLTGACEWNLSEVKGDALPDGIPPMWYPGFFALKQSAAKRAS
ncbi:MAG: HAD-IA family hydrolase [Nitrospira sp.]